MARGGGEEGAKVGSYHQTDAPISRPLQQTNMPLGDRLTAVFSYLAQSYSNHLYMYSVHHIFYKLK